MNHRLFIYKLLPVIFIIIGVACNPYEDEGYIPVTSGKLISELMVKEKTSGDVRSDFLFTIPEPMRPVIEIQINTEYDIEIYKISYKTEFKGKQTVASGLVIVPLSVNDIPVISFQNGTNTLHADAPSVNIGHPGLSMLQVVASMGYMVVIPDYLGFGASSKMFHPYLEKASTVQSIRDMLEAVRELAGNKYLNIELNDNLYLMGYSQGGWASLAVTEDLDKNKAGGFNLKGTAIGGGPYNLTTLMEDILSKETYPMPVFLGYLIHSYVQMGEVTITYADVFYPPYRNIIPGLYNGTRTSAYINSQLSDQIEVLFSQEFREDYYTADKYKTFMKALADNSIEPWNTTIPLFIRHGNNDTYVPTSQSSDLKNGFLSKGVSAQKIDYKEFQAPFQDHEGALMMFGLEGLSWLLGLE